MTTRKVIEFPASRSQQVAFEAYPPPAPPEENDDVEAALVGEDVGAPPEAPSPLPQGEEVGMPPEMVLLGLMTEARESVAAIDYVLSRAGIPTHSADGSTLLRPEQRMLLLLKRVAALTTAFSLAIGADGLNRAGARVRMAYRATEGVGEAAVALTMEYEQKMAAARAAAEAAANSAPEGGSDAS